MSRSARLAGHIRLTHPFPSLLDGLVAAATAILAGGTAPTAIRLGLSMVLLQAAVGAFNDVVDAPHDAGRKPGKPIPAGLVRPATARMVAFTAAAAGLLLAMPSGLPTTALAGFLLWLGYVYDVRLKGTAWSWLPFAVAIPLFPTYGWLGAAGGLPPFWGLLLATAVIAGVALAIANASVDIERDRAAGLDSVAIRLGRRRAWAVQTVLLVIVVLLAVGSLVVARGEAPFVLGVLGASSLIGLGATWVRHDAPARRERGWELEAVGTGLLAAAWLAGVVVAG